MPPISAKWGRFRMIRRHTANELKEEKQDEKDHADGDRDNNFQASHRPPCFQMNCPRAAGTRSATVSDGRFSSAWRHDAAR